MSKRRHKTTATEQPCGACGEPVLERYVCDGCMDRYHGHLARVPDVVRDLELEHARLAVKGGQISGRGSAEQPLPYVPAASAALDRLRNALATAVRALVLDQEPPADRIGAMVGWLVQREASIPLRPEGPDIVVELDGAMQRAAAVCDNPPERVLRGRCVCGEELRAPLGQAVVRCRGCGQSWSGEMLDDVRDAAVRDHLADWDELRAYAMGALRVPPQTLDSWKSRRKITPTASGLYRVADLIALDSQRKRKAG